MKIELTDCPAILQEAVQKYIKEHKDAKIICISIAETTPYIDKSIISTAYNVSLEAVNYYTSLRFSVCSKEEWTDRAVSRDSMSTRQIIDIVNNSEWLTEMLQRFKAPVE